MPNYVKNIVKAEGICRLPLFSEENGKRYFDFNKIIPMPESLNVDAGSVTDSAIVYYLTEKCTIPIPCLSKERKEILRQTVSNLFHRGDLSWAQEIFTRVSVDMFLKNEMAKEEILDDSGKSVRVSYEDALVFTTRENISKDYGGDTWEDVRMECESETLKELALYAGEPETYCYIDCTDGEYLPICGGCWSNPSIAGVFYVNLLSPRSNSYSLIGFRSAFYRKRKNCLPPGKAAGNQKVE